MKKQKYVYLVDGWTNQSEDLRRITPYYALTADKRKFSAERIDWVSDLKELRKMGRNQIREIQCIKWGLGPHVTRDGQIQPKPPCKIVVAEQKVTRASANFESAVLYHLGLIPKNKKIAEQLMWAV